MKRRWKENLCIVGFFMFAGSVGAATTVSINYTDGGGGLGPSVVDQTAGVEGTGFWETAYRNAAKNDTQLTDLRDSDGNYTGVEVVFSGAAGGSYNTANTIDFNDAYDDGVDVYGATTHSNKMMNNWTRSSSSDAITLEFSNVGKFASLYDVIVYARSSSTATAKYTINSTTFNMAYPNNSLADKNYFAAQSAGVAADKTKNYMRFSGVNLDSFSLTVTGVNAPINGVQIVKVAEPAAVPTGVNSSNVDTTSFELAWEDMSAQSYDLLISEKPDLSSPIFTDIATNSTNSTVTGLSSATTYYYGVRANYGAASSAYSVGEVATLATVNSPSDIVVSDVTAFGFSLSWSVVTDADRYEVGVSENSDFSELIYVNAELADSSVSVKSLSGLTDYYYRVRAVGNGGNSLYSSGSVKTLFDAGTTCGVQYGISESWNSSSRWDFSVETSGASSNISTTVKDNASWFENFSDSLVTVEPNSTFTLTISNDDPWFGGKVWIDWNRDGVFDDETELVGYFSNVIGTGDPNRFTAEYVNSESPNQLVVTVPDSVQASLPFSTRIRVRSIDIGYQDPESVLPDGYSRVGQGHDYGLTVFNGTNYSITNSFEDGLEGWYNNTPAARFLPIESFVSGESVASGRFTPKIGLKLVREDDVGSRDGTDYNLKILSSPELKLSSSSEISAWLLGGVGGESRPVQYSEFIDLDLDTVANTGFMGLALRRLSDGKYLLFATKDQNGQYQSGYELHGWSATDLATATSSDDLATERYVVDLIDSFRGDWGWIAMDDFNFTQVAVPANLDATLLDGYINVSWSAVSGADHYSVIISENEDLSNPAIEDTVVATRSLNYTASGLAKDTEYYVGVAAVENGYLSEYNVIGDPVYTPAIGLRLVQTGTEVTWTVSEEINVAKYVLVDVDTGEVVSEITATGAHFYTVFVPDGVNIMLIVVDNSGFTKSYLPSNGNIVNAVYTLVKGWNMIAMPGDDADISELKEVTSGAIWGWNGESYEIVEAPIAGYAVWVYAPFDVEIVISAERVEASLDLQAGWNMVGPAETIKVPAEAHTVYTWSDAYQIIANDGALMEGVGYWIFCD